MVVSTTAGRTGRTGKHRLIPAVLYLRRSKKKQQGSIRQQREDLYKFAAEHGYRIIREYVEDGISGDDTKSRKAFQRLREDVAIGDFEVILCWDLERFGRPDSLAFGYWAFPIREAKI